MLTHNHLSRCRCRHEFCYVCSTPWKQCECAHWDEAMLEERAGVIAARNQPARPARQVVEQAAQFLVEQHDCYHDGAWKKLGISAECEECGDLMPDYIFECRHCGLQACNACRINRFWLKGCEKEAWNGGWTIRSRVLITYAKRGIQMAKDLLSSETIPGIFRKKVLID